MWGISWLAEDLLVSEELLHGVIYRPTFIPRKHCGLTKIYESLDLSFII